MLRLEIGADGNVARVDVVTGSGDSTLDDAFVAAATQMQYSPCVLASGDAAACTIGYRITFDVVQHPNDVVSTRICGHSEPPAAAL